MSPLAERVDFSGNLGLHLSPRHSHSNIDRLYALWQAIHYESEFENQEADFRRLPFTGMTDEVNTTLRPFYSTQDQPWTSSMVQKSTGDPGPTYVPRGGGPKNLGGETG